MSAEEPSFTSAGEPEKEAASPPLGARGERGAVAAAWNGWPGRVFRLIFAVVPLVWITTRIHWSTVAERAARVGIGPILYAFAALASTSFISGLRWKLVLRAWGAERSRIPSVLTLSRHFFVSLYFNVLPSGVAGDVVRAYRVVGCLPDLLSSLLIVFVERLAGLMGLLLIAGASAVLSPELRHGPLATVMNIGLVLAIGFLAVAFVLPQFAQRHPGTREFVRRVPIIGPTLARLPAAQNAIGPIAAVVLSIFTQGAVVLAVHALLAPLAPTADLAVCARIVPAIVLVTYIPLTPGGLGQREAAFVAFFSTVHVDPAAAVAASLLLFAVNLGLALVGGLVLVYERARGIETTIPAA